MTNASADRDLTPVLPRRFRSFFLLLSGLLGLLMYAVVQVGTAEGLSMFRMTPFAADVQQVVMPYLIWPSLEQALQVLGMLTLTPAVADAAMMALLLFCAAVVVVRDGTVRLSAVVSLAVVALLLAWPFYAQVISVNARWLAAGCMLVPVFAVPGMLKAGPASTALRRLTFGFGLGLLLAVLLVVLERLVMLVLEVYGAEVLPWRSYVVAVVALPVWVRLLVKALRESLPDAEDLADAEDARPSVSAGGSSTTRPVAVLLLMVGVLVAFCMPIQDLMMGDSRRWAAVAVLLLFLVCYARSILVVVMSWRFWLCAVLLGVMPVWDPVLGVPGASLGSSGTDGGAVLAGGVVVPLVGGMLGCLVVSFLMRFWCARRVMLVCVALALLLVVLHYVLLYCLAAESIQSVAAVPAVEVQPAQQVPLSCSAASACCPVWYVCGSVLRRAVLVAASCGLYACGLRGFSSREGSLAFGMMCAVIPVLYLLSSLCVYGCSASL